MRFAEHNIEPDDSPDWWRGLTTQLVATLRGIEAEEDGEPLAAFDPATAGMLADVTMDAAVPHTQPDAFLDGINFALCVLIQTIDNETIKATPDLAQWYQNMFIAVDEVMTSKMTADSVFTEVMNDPDLLEAMRQVLDGVTSSDEDEGGE